MRITLTQNQINHGVFGLFTIIMGLIVLRVLMNPFHIETLIVTAIFVGTASLWFAYWRGWPYARQALVLLVTLGAAAGTPSEFLLRGFSHVVYIAPALALVLLSPAWVVISSAIVTSTFAFRAGGGPYMDPVQVMIYSFVIGGMLLSRLAVDNTLRLETALRAASDERARAEAERERAEQQARELEQRAHEQARLLELISVLETPTIHIADGVLLAPIVGALDSRRAQALTTRLLRDVSEQRMRRVILDIGGVTAVDTQVAQVLLQTASALRMLGCRVAITGITATVALTLTQLGVAMNDVVTARSPQDVLTTL